MNARELFQELYKQGTPEVKAWLLQNQAAAAYAARTAIYEHHAEVARLPLRLKLTGNAASEVEIRVEAEDIYHDESDPNMLALFQAWREGGGTGEIRVSVETAEAIERAISGMVESLEESLKERGPSAEEKRVYRSALTGLGNALKKLNAYTYSIEATRWPPLFGDPL
jgi:actin-like ATPase involved in cell morphogenesis